MAVRMAAMHKAGMAPVTRRRRIRNPDPNLHYYWASGEGVQHKQDDFGYQIVRGNGELAENPRSVEGAVTSGDCVLLACPREEYEARQKERNKRALEAMRGPREAFKSTGAQHGVPTIDVSKERYGAMREALGQERDIRLQELTGNQ